MKKIPFKVSARAARLIGRENVATSQSAVTELVKNAYDADADVCAIFFLRRFPGIPQSLSVEDYVGLSETLKGCGRFYASKDDTFELVDGLKDDALAMLSKELDNIVDLWIVDNGKGMSRAVIEQFWMVIGTDVKEITAKSTGGRILTGAKGIGRFALDRLGQKCKLYSLQQFSREVVCWEVDWGDFEGEGKIIDDVTAILKAETRSYHSVLSAVGLDALLPTHLPVRDDNVTKLSFSHGTAIGISSLHDIWDQRDSIKLRETLEALLPLKDRGNFNIFVYDHRIPRASGWINNFPPDQFDYKLHANVREDGIAAIEIYRQEIDTDSITPTFYTLPGIQKSGYRKEDFERGIRTYERKLADIVTLTDGDTEADILNIGPLDFTLYFFKLSNPTSDNLKRFSQKRFNVTKRRNWLKASGGIRLYRDGFRVRPYGEPNTQGSDWLLLGQRTAQNPTGVATKGHDWRVPPQQVAGTIHISKERNSLLADQSNREGIMNERAFALFRKVILALIREFERDRNYVFIHFNEAYEIDNPDDGVLEKGKKIANKVLISNQKGKTDNDSSSPSLQNSEIISSFIADADSSKVMAEALNISERRNDSLKDEIQVLRGMATLGTVLVSFTHELKQIKANMGSRQQRMENALDRVVEKSKVKLLPNLVDPYNILKRWGREDEKVSRWVDFALASVSPVKRRRGSIAWQSYLRNLKQYWREFLSERSIDLAVPESIETDPHVLAYEIDIDSIFYNLIINSFEAFSRPSQQASREIVIKVKDITDDQVHFEYKDNGPGIPASFNIAEDIFLYGYTSKRETQNNDLPGTGIGMWLVKAIFDDYGGRVEILSKMGQPHFSLALTLPLYKRKKAR
ncbi:MAG: sensor histidine kinase [Aestuariivita sp.]|nr:sensor histidine kinase [Aestuariivita sp.]